MFSYKRKAKRIRNRICFKLLIIKKIKKMRQVTQQQHQEVEEFFNSKLDYVSPEVYNYVKSKKEIEHNVKNNVKIGYC